MPYQYQPLPILQNSEDVYIRLLEVHRGPRSGPITGRLYTTLLSEAPKFYALSYCWGPEPHEATIHITNAAPPRDLENDNTLKIPKTLIPLLYEIRGWRWLETRTIWVDSVCLDQKNKEEKTAQVPKMRQIYMKASVTVSWLGLGEEGIEAAFEYASGLNKTYRRELAEQGQYVLSPAEEIEKDVRVKVKLGDPALETLLRLLDRPYFERAWIMQEVVVSSQVVFVCGSAKILWQSLLGAYLYLTLNQLWLWEFYQGVKLVSIILMRLSEMEWGNGVDLDWPGTLLRHRSCFSGDAKDKIFAFYGMRCKKALDELVIEPDYDEALTTEILYTRLAARALRKGQVAILHVPRLVTNSLEESDNRVVRLTLPSWVPDWQWTEATPQSLVMLEIPEKDADKARDYHASNNSGFKPSFDIEAYNSPPELGKHPENLPKMLRLSGVAVARVTQLTPRRWELPKAPLLQSLLDQAKLLQFNMQQVHEWEVLFRPQHAKQLYSATGESATEAMYEMFTACETQHTPEAKRNAYGAFEKRQKILRLLHTFNIHRFLVCYIVVVLVERVFRRFGWVNPEVEFRSMTWQALNRKGARIVGLADSKTTYYALVPSICRLGDHVVLVGGVMTPLILREGEGTWEFIGDAYIHGMMKGELWEKSKGNCQDMWIA
ncbi:hypothetical protein J4E80_008174 [Alternaria sp. BMP 0032]|nr:hypothetical protein J4E80_008174 [Alternaria sp. BMP 0032]